MNADFRMQRELYQGGVARLALTTLARLRMNWYGSRSTKPVWMLIAIGIAMLAQGAMAQSKSDDGKPAESRPAEARAPRVEIYKVFYLTHALQNNDLNDVQTALRNVLPRAHIYGMPSQNAICLSGTTEELETAQRVVSDLDHAPKSYRLTFTIRETDGGKKSSEQHYSMIVSPGVKTDFRQGSRVPILTGSSEAGAAATQFQYIDVGLSVTANFDGTLLRSKIEQSAVADEKSSVGLQDPVIRQAQLEGNAALVEGKPMVLGALDVPGSSRHEEIEVVAEAVK
jgi:type II secretory pathway component GspD/PulD (secretin)